MSAREMLIEFERRLTLMNPGFELKEKVTSDTIFSFLNAYVLRYINLNYLQDDVVQDNSRALKKSLDTIKGLVVRTNLKTTRQEDTTDVNTYTATLPEDYFLYIRSNSRITSSYKNQFGAPTRKENVAKVIFLDKEMMENAYNGDINALPGYKESYEFLDNSYSQHFDSLTKVGYSYLFVYIDDTLKIENHKLECHVLDMRIVKKVTEFEYTVLDAVSLTEPLFGYKQFRNPVSYSEYDE